MSETPGAKPDEIGAEKGQRAYGEAERKQAADLSREAEIAELNRKMREAMQAKSDAAAKNNN